MAWSFRRSGKVAPGIRINFSKSGVSWTVGHKGFKVNSGPRGTYVTQSIPGTGIYNRRKLKDNISSMGVQQFSKQYESSLSEGYYVSVYVVITSLICALIAQNWFVCPIVIVSCIVVWVLISLAPSQEDKINKEIQMQLNKLKKLLEQMSRASEMNEIDRIYNEMRMITDVELYERSADQNGIDHELIEREYHKKILEIVKSKKLYLR